MRHIAVSLLASSLLALFTGAQAHGLGTRMERAMIAPPPAKTSRTRRLTADDAAAGLKSVLGDAANVAVLQLGTPGGFSENASYRIGQLAAHSGVVTEPRDALLNQAAEHTASQAGPLLRETINELHMPNPQRLIDGKATAASDFLRDHSAEALRNALSSIAARSYLDRQQGHRSPPRASDTEPTGPRIADHIAHATVHALLDTIGQQEAEIRRSPAARGTPLLACVFGPT